MSLFLAITLSALALRTGPAWLGFGAAFFVLAGFSSIAPEITFRFSRAVQATIHQKIEPRLAAQNLGRTLLRNSVTIASLAAAVAMTVGIAVMVFSFRQTVGDWINQTLIADLFIGPAANEIAGPTSFVPPAAIFGRWLADLAGWQVDLGSLFGRLLFIVSCAWLAAGLLSVAALGIPAVERSSLGAAARSGVGALPAGRLGVTEALVVLGTIDLVVAVFVGLQIAYLFGGLDTLVAAGMTYSDYARRGFFELVAAACLAGALMVALETTVARRTRPYLAALLALLALTAVVLISAALRLRLYQDAYGWTELRLYVLMTIGTLAVTLLLMAVLAVRGQMRWLGHGLAVIGVVSLITLNLVAPAAFVAERNVERVIDPSLVPADGHAGLDAAYLRVLPDDAIPVLVGALPALPATERQAVLPILRERQAELASDPAFSGAAAWNLGRERARQALQTLP